MWFIFFVPAPGHMVLGRDPRLIVCLLLVPNAISGAALWATWRARWYLLPLAAVALFAFCVVSGFFGGAVDLPSVPLVTLAWLFGLAAKRSKIA
jgi:hypothetical protein